MFFHTKLLTRKGRLGTVWYAGHCKSHKLTKKKIMETDILDVCKVINEQMKNFALRVNISLVLGATLILQRQAMYLLQDAEQARKAVRNSVIFVDPKTTITLTDKQKSARKGKAKLAAPETMVQGVAALMAQLDMDNFEEEFEPQLAGPLVGIAEPSSILLREARWDVQRSAIDDDRLVDDFGGTYFPPDFTKNLNEDISMILPHDEPEPEPHPEPFRQNGAKSHPSLVVPPDDPHNRSSAPHPDKPVPIVVPEPLPAVNPRPRRNKKVVFDQVTTIPMAQMKRNIESVRFACRSDIPLPNSLELKHKQEKKISWKYGSGLLEGSKLARFFVDNGGTKAARKGEAVAGAEVDPFGWCGPAPAPVEDLPRPSAARAEKQVVRPKTPVPPQVDPVDANGHPEPLSVILDIPKPLPPAPDSNGHDKTNGGLSEVPSVTTSENQRTEKRAFVSGDLPVKRTRSEVEDLVRQQRVEQNSMAGSYLEMRYEKFHDGQSVSFQRLMDGNSRKKVARCFMYILQAAKDGKVTLAQEEPYAEIVVEKTSPGVSLEYGLRFRMP